MDAITHYFTGNNITYCAPTDAMCTVCRSKFQASATTKKTIDQVRWQYCVGDGGCLCTGMCEVPRYRDVMIVDNYPCMVENRYYVYEREPQIPAFTTRRRDPLLSPPHELVTERLGDESCEFAPQLDVQGCRHGRTSMSCLGKKGCVLMERACSDVSQYDAQYDYRDSDMWNTQLRFFDDLPGPEHVCLRCR